MKIEGPRGPDKSSATRKADGASSADAAMFRGLMASGEAESATPASATQNIAALDILLAVQAVEDPTARAARRRMTARSGEMLDLLDKIRMGMLTGNLTVGDMVDVADVVATHREKIHDPQLTSLLDEIDLRAQVEIAKLRMALNSTSHASA